MDTPVCLTESSEAFRLDTAGTWRWHASGSESISQFGRVELEVPSTDGTSNAAVPTEHLIKLIPAVQTREVQTHV